MYFNSEENDTNKENELSPYFGQEVSGIKYEMSSEEIPCSQRGLKYQYNNARQENNKSSKISSKIAQIKEEDTFGQEAELDANKSSKTETKRQKWEPENWLEQLNLIRTMRSQSNAPVDTMGCDSNWDSDSTPQVNISCSFIYSIKCILQ